MAALALMSTEPHLGPHPELPREPFLSRSCSRSPQASPGALGGTCLHLGPSRDTRSLSWERRPQSITGGTVFAACQVLLSQLVSRS